MIAIGPARMTMALLARKTELAGDRSWTSR
jgi:hypothetical protein